MLTPGSGPVRPASVARTGPTAGDHGVVRSLGLRYARAARFEPARAAEGQLRVARAAEVPVFPQLPSRLDGILGPCAPVTPRSEDAFFLNVFAPEGARALPVAVFLHGGAWATGGGTLPWYDGSALAARGMVVVCVNYRIGALGHLAGPESGNLPLGDLLRALEWVSACIRAYGGDPDRVSLVGQSAGAWWAHALSLSPEASGLFRRVALWSLGEREPWDAHEARSRRENARSLLPGAHPARADGLSTAAVSDVLAAGAAAVAPAGDPWALPPGYLPVALGLPPNLMDPAAAARGATLEAVLIERTRTEAASFLHAAPGPAGEADRARAIAAAGWRRFGRFSASYAAELRARGVTVTEALFDPPEPPPGERAHPAAHGHCADLPYRFGNPGVWAASPLLTGVSAARYAAAFEASRERLYAFVAG